MGSFSCLHLGVESYGLLVGDEVTDLQTRVCGSPETSLPSTMEELIGLGKEGTRTVKQLISNCARLPAGVAVFKKPTPKFLSPGDLVEVEIENIGTLRNKLAKTA